MSVCCGMDKTDILMCSFFPQIIESLGCLEDKYKSVLCDVVSVHEGRLRKKLLSDTAAVSHSMLQDFDWKLQVSHFFLFLVFSPLKSACNSSYV